MSKYLPAEMYVITNQKNGERESGGEIFKPSMQLIKDLK